jgi:hypothetical protein
MVATSTDGGDVRKDCPNDGRARDSVPRTAGRPQCTDCAGVLLSRKFRLLECSAFAGDTLTRVCPPRAQPRDAGAMAFPSDAAARASLLFAGVVLAQVTVLLRRQSYSGVSVAQASLNMDQRGEPFRP